MFMIGVEDLAVFCKKKGFVNHSSEIYGGLSGFFDYGPLGVELRNNIKSLWWRVHVSSRRDVVGVDGSLITNPSVWKASGHVDGFVDPVLVTKKSKKKVRADFFIEESLGVDVSDMSVDDINKLIKEKGLKYEGEEFEDLKNVNLMMRTNVGSSDDFNFFLRPETAQSIFTNFGFVQDTSRLKLPFGIAQVGRAFRNEISPRDFLFRCREFEQMELEYFVDPNVNCVFSFDKFKFKDVNVLSEKSQVDGKGVEVVSFLDLVSGKLMDSWLAYWICFEFNWIVSLGLSRENIRLREHKKNERAHYSESSWDLEYNFPFGWKELVGFADRGVFDLSNHSSVSGRDLKYFDQESNSRFFPRVVEPSFGVERLFLALMFDAYSVRKDEKGNDVVVLKLNPCVSPVDVAVFPLLSNKKELVDKAEEVFSLLSEELSWCSFSFDKSGSIGRRYVRQDEVGTPFCVTVDFDSLTDGGVTIRDSDSMDQVRVPIKSLIDKLRKRLV